MRAPVLVLFLALAACRQEMADQPRHEALEASTTFADGASARLPVAGTVSRDADLGAIPDSVPGPVDPDLLRRGKERFDIYCAPCHGPTGRGDGMIVQHGFPAPPDYLDPRLMQAADRHFYDVMTNGYGVMYPYRARVAPPDRWAIVAYIRALQLAGHARVAALPQRLQGKLEALP